MQIRLAKSELKSASRIGRWILALTAILLVVPGIQRSLAATQVRIAVNRVLLSPWPSDQMLERLGALVPLVCGQFANESCPGASAPDAEMIAYLDDWVQRGPPLQVIQDNAQVPTDALMLGGYSRVNRILDGIAELYGPGHISARVFFLPATPQRWALQVTARNDTPAPIALEVRFDNTVVGQMLFDRGDHSWETHSLDLGSVRGYRHIYVAFINDYYDRALGLDRNAHIREIAITSLEH